MPPRQDARLRTPTMPQGTEVASYQTYLEASNAVDYLSDSGFQVKSITIVGTDLHMVERVTGRLTMGKVAASGAGSGALWGMFMGLMLSIAAPGQGAGLLFLLGLGGGALFGVIMSVALYAAAGGQRDFTSQSQVVASRYAVLASADIDHAFQLLQQTPGNQTRPAPRRTRPQRSGPTEYGSRADEQPRFGVRIDEGGAGASAPESAPEGEASRTNPHTTPQDAAQPSVAPQGPSAEPERLTTYPGQIAAPSAPQYGQRASSEDSSEGSDDESR